MKDKKIISLLSNFLELETSKLEALDKDSSLLDYGVDSLSFIKFIVLLEDEFLIEIHDSDLLISNFNTINKISKILDKYIHPSKPLKKVLISDCDNVLWRGIAGEEQIYICDSSKKFQERVLHTSNN